MIARVVERIAPAGRIEIEQVHEQARALGVAEELVPEPAALAARPG